MIGVLWLSCQMTQQDGHLGGTSPDGAIELSEIELPIGLFPPLDFLKIHPLSGVVSGPAPVRGGDDLSLQYAAMGVTGVRTHEFYDALDISVIFPDFDKDPDTEADALTWSTSDTAFNTIVADALGPYFRIGESTPSGLTVPLPETVAQRDNWRKAIRRIIDHYHASLPPDLGAVEIWNEPDSPTFWSQTPTEFADAFADVMEYANETYRELWMGGPGLSQNVIQDILSSGSSEWWNLFRNRILYRFGLLDPTVKDLLQFEFLSFHHFSDTPSTYEVACDTFFRMVEEFSPLIDLQFMEADISAWGIVSDPDSRASAANLAACWIAIQNQRHIPVGDNGQWKWISRAYYYTGNNASGEGLIRGDGVPTVSSAAFALCSAFSDEEQNRKYLVAQSTVPGIHCLGAVSDGMYAVLLANPGGDRRILEFKFVAKEDTNGDGIPDSETKIDMVPEILQKVAVLDDGTPGIIGFASESANLVVLEPDDVVLALLVKL